MEYRRVGNSGLLLPSVSLGLWHRFGTATAQDEQRALIAKALELGVTHFDLANNYGPPPGAAEESFGRMLQEDFLGERDNIVISTKAGYPMWNGPYGEWGSRKHMVSSLDQSLRRLQVDYVDIFYSHRFDPDTPLEETMGALASAVTQGKALYVGISSYSTERTQAARQILEGLGVPLLVHQPSYSLLNRWVESSKLLADLADHGVGCVAFSALAQGMLTDRYIDGVPQDSRAKDGANTSLESDMLSEENLAKVSSLREIAAGRNQTLAQMAISWVLRNSVVSTALTGASSPAQLEANCSGLDTAFSEDELSTIDGFATESGINLWSASSSY